MTVLHRNSIEKCQLFVYDTSYNKGILQTLNIDAANTKYDLHILWKNLKDTNIMRIKGFYVSFFKTPAAYIKHS